MAGVYRQIVSFIKDKTIKIENVRGFAHACQFEVDEIDAARLKVANLVVDFSDGSPEDNPTFYIDPELDTILDETIDSISEALYEELGIPSEVTSNPEEIFKEQSSHLHLSDLLERHDDDDDDDENRLVGSIEIDIKKIGEDKFSFDLSIPDLGMQPQNVQFDRESSDVKFKCSSCDEWHQEPLQSVYNSLITATALMSNIVEMTQGTKEFSTALEMIEHDLRLLQELIKFDYALEDPRDDDDLDDDEDGDDDHHSHDHS